jgi:hypothetical protein
MLLQCGNKKDNNAVLSPDPSAATNDSVHDRFRQCKKIGQRADFAGA